MAEVFDPNCLLCGEEIVVTDMPPQLIGTLGGPRYAHRECNLREVLGGIGHLVAHEYWCKQQHDPDAGLTYRQSALLVYQWVQIIGVEATAERGSMTP